MCQHPLPAIGQKQDLVQQKKPSVDLIIRLQVRDTTMDTFCFPMFEFHFLCGGLDSREKGTSKQDIFAT